MGLFTTPEQVHLVPVHPPVAVFTPFIARAPTTLELKEKMFSWTGDDFAVKDAATGQTVIRCQGKMMSLRECKAITDASGRPLFNLRNKMMTIHTTFLAENAAGEEIFRVRKHMSCESPCNGLQYASMYPPTHPTPAYAQSAPR